jgi:hypothetical protein
LIPAKLGSQFGAEYTYSDMDLESGITYYYWLEAVDTHGAMDLMDPVTEEMLLGKK